MTGVFTIFNVNTYVTESFFVSFELTNDNRICMDEKELSEDEYECIPGGLISFY